MGSLNGMLDQFGIHIDLFRYVLLSGLIFTRIFTLSMVVPFLGGKPIPGRVRIAVCVALTVFFYFPVAWGAPENLPDQGVILFALFLKELMVGFMLGLCLAFIFYGIQAAGNMVDNQRQLANARIFNPALGSQASLFGVFFYQLSIVIFLTMGGHRVFMEGLGRSFQSIPVLQFPHFGPGIEPVLQFLMQLSADTLIICLQLSAPVLVAIFLADLILGLTNRVAPMVNVFEMGFNLKGFIGVALVYLSLPLIILQLGHWFEYSLKVFDKVVNFFIR